MIKGELATKWLTKIPDNLNKDKRKEKHIKVIDKQRVLCKSKLKQVEIANNNEA
jgi:hypothetical protein